MTPRFLGLYLLTACTALAQAPRDSERRADRPAPRVERSQCDALAGAEQERCLAEEAAVRERLGRTEPPKKCDDLFGPEKELCLKKGGSVKAGIGPGGAGR